MQDIKKSRKLKEIAITPGIRISEPKRCDDDPTANVTFVVANENKETEKIEKEYQIFKYRQESYIHEVPACCLDGNRNLVCTASNDNAYISIMALIKSSSLESVDVEERGSKISLTCNSSVSKSDALTINAEVKGISSNLEDKNFCMEDCPCRTRSYRLLEPIGDPVKYKFIKAALPVAI